MFLYLILDTWRQEPLLTCSLAPFTLSGQERESLLNSTADAVGDVGSLGHTHTHPVGRQRQRSPSAEARNRSIASGRPETFSGGKETVTLKSWIPSSKNFSPVHLERQLGTPEARRPGSRCAAEETLGTGACAPLLQLACCPQVPSGGGRSGSGWVAESRLIQRRDTQKGARSP